MKLEIIKEFSDILARESFRVYQDGRFIDGFESEEYARDFTDNLKRNFQEFKGNEVVYSEEF